MTETEYAARADTAKETLYRTALLYLRSPTLALEAVDETVYKGFQAFRKLREDRYFDTWLTRILINVCHNELRRHRRELAMEELPETAREEFDTLPLRDAVGRLPRALKEVILLRYFTGLTLSETAQTLGIPQGTAATRQRRALALLRLELTDEEEAEA